MINVHDILETIKMIDEDYHGYIFIRLLRQ